MSIAFEKDGFRVQLAQSQDDLRRAQRLRYDVFVRELGGQGAGVDSVAQTETDRFDDVADHLILTDLSNGEAVGVYRLLRADPARAVGGYYSQSEYDLSPLLASSRNLLELGRSCVRADHRGGTALFHLWMGLAAYVEMHGCDLLFGAASLPGTDMARLAEPLSLLHHRFLAPPELRVTSRMAQPMDLIPIEQLDRRSAMVQIPPLIKAYLRMGGVVGQGAFVDQDFNCTDVCMIMDTAAMTASAAQFQRQVAAQ